MQTKVKVGKSLRYRFHGYVSSFLATLGLVLLFLSGCATPATSIVGAKKDLLEFLSPGHTTREEVLSTLGRPNRVFEQEKILFYRLGHDEKQGYYICNWIGSWEGVRYSLVLVFDPNGVLCKHRLVDVQ